MHSRVGSALQFAAFIKAGYIVSSKLRVVKGNNPTVTLDMLVPELPRFVRMLQTESAGERKPVSEKEYISYVDSHSDFFATRQKR